MVIRVAFLLCVAWVAHGHKTPKEKFVAPTPAPVGMMVGEDD